MAQDGLANECSGCGNVFPRSALLETQDGSQLCDRCWKKKDHPTLKNPAPRSKPTVSEYPDES